MVPLHSLNFAIADDQTQHVLWRLQNGELDNIEPKVRITHACLEEIIDSNR